jgi:hypothetical protein
MRLRRALLLPLATVASLALAATASAANPNPSTGVNPNPSVGLEPVPRPVVVHSRANTWHTCVPQATLHRGIYQFDNDLFIGSDGPSCITVRGTSLTIDRNYRRAYNVVAYPAVRIGDYPYNRDPKSGLPEQVAKVKLILHIRNTGSNPGVWIDDLDIWFGHSAATATHHIREVIIVDRWSNYQPFRGNHAVKIGRRRWFIAKGYTGSGGHGWPLIRFVARHQTRHATINLAAFLKVARRHHWITGHMVLSSVSDGTECWSGCRGLTDSMFVKHRHEHNHHHKHKHKSA